MSSRTAQKTAIYEQCEREREQLQHDRFEEEPELDSFNKQLEQETFKEEQFERERNIEEKQHGDEVVSALYEITGVLNTLDG